MNNNFRITANLQPSPDDDRDYTAVFPRADKIRVDLRHPSDEMEDQGAEGTCVSNATCSLLENIATQYGRAYDLSRHFVDYTTKDYENRVGQEGVVLRDALKMLRKVGVCSEFTWPYLPETYNALPSATAFNEAAKSRIFRFERIVQDPDSTSNTAENIKAAIQAGYRVVVAAWIRKRFLRLSGDMALHHWDDTRYSDNNEPVGAHAFLIVGFDKNLGGGSFIIQNSWGNQWGDNGFAAYSYAQLGDVFEAWVVRGFEKFDLPYSTNERLAAALYVALFNRLPEADGMAYWVRDLQSMPAVQVAQNMFDCFPARQIYPEGASNEMIVKAFYQNALGRMPDADGFEYWKSMLDNGYKVGSFVLAIVTAAMDYKGSDPVGIRSRNLFNNKIEAGCYGALRLGVSNIDACKNAVSLLTHEKNSVSDAIEYLKLEGGML